MLRTTGIAFGLITHAVFFYTVWKLFWFLKQPAAAATGHLEIDAMLACSFAVPHSLLLYPAVRTRIERVVPSAHYGCLFCLVTCLALLVLFSGWRSSSVVLWQFEDWMKTGMNAGFFASWGALFYSLNLNGLGYQTGWTPWWHWLRGRPLPRRRFEPRGAYRWLRHPVYLSFLGLLWFSPTMTLDHAILTGTWTAYILVGSWLKDRRLVYYLGDRYREYQSRVVGFPFMPFGPLARVLWPTPTNPVARRCRSNRLHRHDV